MIGNECFHSRSDPANALANEGPPNTTVVILCIAERKIRMRTRMKLLTIAAIGQGITLGWLAAAGKFNPDRLSW